MLGHPAFPGGLSSSGSTSIGYFPLFFFFFFFNRQCSTLLGKGKGRSKRGDVIDRNFFGIFFSEQCLLKVGNGEGGRLILFFLLSYLPCGSGWSSTIS